MRFRHGFWLISTSKQEQLKHLNNFCLLIWLVWQCSNKDLLNSQRGKGNLNIGIDSFFFPSPLSFPSSSFHLQRTLSWRCIGFLPERANSILRTRVLKGMMEQCLVHSPFGSSPWFTSPLATVPFLPLQRFLGKTSRPCSKMNPAVLHTVTSASVAMCL